MHQGRPGVDNPPPRQRNRRWMGVLAITPVIMAGLGTLAVISHGHQPEPRVGLAPPAGYQAITDAYFAFAIPNGWTQNSAYTDANGDIFYQGAGGWVGETLVVRNTPPTPAEQPPVSLASFGQARPTPYSLTNPAPMQIRGTDVAQVSDLVRGGQVQSRVVHTWERATQTELWLVVHTAPGTASTVITSLRGA